MSLIDDQWWNTLLEDTKNLTQPFVFKNAFNAYVDRLQGLTMNVFKELAQDGSDLLRFRVWVEDQTGTIKESTEFAQKIIAAPPVENETLSEWTERLFGKRKFGIIINDGEAFNTEMNKTLVSIVEPLFNIIGLPLNGICTTYFVGNYGFTPLGIHQDVKGEDVFHFHLGPGSKTMYTWDENEYKKLSGVENNQDIEPLLKHADAYTFHTGDVFYMPWFKYHIGYSSELSLGLTIWLNNLSPRKLLTNIFEQMLQQMLPVSSQSKAPVLLPLDKGISQARPEQYRNLQDYLSFPAEGKSQSFEQYFASLFEDYRLKLFSNGGFKLLQSLQANHDQQLTLDSVIGVSNPFRIYYKTVSQRMHLYIRGYKIQFVFHSALPDIIDILNQGEVHPISVLADQLLQDWEEESVLYFFKTLLNYGGIQTSSVQVPTYS